MNAFAPVRAIRNRHKCVTLAFEAARTALADEGQD
jgi:NifU-like protein involved in Fe-S cluster formation